ncbi:MAG: peptidoglycan-binding protein [Kiloniellales bacterium]|nr:peptidoglycan-binding protein [Kiloniellales bacterium]
MRIFILILATIPLVAMALDYVFVQRERNREKAVLRWTETLVVEALPSEREAMLFRPFAERDDDRGVWRVGGAVRFKDEMNREPVDYEATIEELCDEFGKRACWRLASLSVAGRDVVPKAEAAEGRVAGVEGEPALRSPAPAPGLETAAAAPVPPSESDDGLEAGSSEVAGSEIPEAGSDRRLEEAAAEPPALPVESDDGALAALTPKTSAEIEMPPRDGPIGGSSIASALPPLEPDGSAAFPSDETVAAPASDELEAAVAESREALVDASMTGIASVTPVPDLSTPASETSPQSAAEVESEAVAALPTEEAGESVAEPAPAAEDGDQNALVRAIQTKLNAWRAGLGEPLVTDGLIGSRTRAAIRTFQRQAGLPEDGQATDALLARLEQALEGGNGAPPPPATETIEGLEPEAAPETLAPASDFQVATVTATTLQTPSGRGAAARSRAPGSAAPIAAITLPSASDPDATAAPGQDSSIVFLIQDRLNRLSGADRPPLDRDGQLGPRTREAILAYQRLHGLEADGRATQELLRHMEMEIRTRGGQTDSSG